MKCVILDYANSDIHIININGKDIDKVEDILSRYYGYRLKDIDYMLTEEINLRID